MNSRYTIKPQGYVVLTEAPHVPSVEAIVTSGKLPNTLDFESSLPAGTGRVEFDIKLTSLSSSKACFQGYESQNHLALSPSKSTQIFSLSRVRSVGFFISHPQM